MNSELREKRRAAGRIGGSAPKTITASDRERRREWARGLAKIRLAKRATIPATGQPITPEEIEQKEQ